LGDLACAGMFPVQLPLMNVCYWHEADIARRRAHVSFWHEAD
jgi:hypothetical protein